MAAAERAATTRVIEELLARGRGFSFFQAVRLLEAGVPDGAPVGHLGPVADEAVRFRPHAGFGFPGADIERVERLGGEGDPFPPYRMSVNFLGLYGSVSPLPPFFTEAIIASDQDDSQRRDFLDLFHHRLISLFYRCWRKYRHYVQYRAGAADPFSARLYALSGFGAPELRGALDLDWERMLGYLGLLVVRGQSAAKLSALVSGYFDGVPVAVEPFMARRVPLGTEGENRLGRRKVSLGRDLVLGGRVPDRAGKFRLVLGPLSLARFRRHLPDGPDHGPLRDLVRLVLHEPLAFDVALRLDEASVPEWNLEAESPCRLGWSTWLGQRPRGEATVTLAGAAA